MTVFFKRALVIVFMIALISICVVFGTGTVYMARAIGDTFATISAESGHSLAIKSDSSLWVWGYNSDGQLGDGTQNDRSTPVKIMDDVATVSAGSDFSFAIKSDGTLWAWGRNAYGQLGDGTQNTKVIPVKIMDSVITISAGHNHSLAIKIDGSLWAWGFNEHGQLGDGTANSIRPTPVKIMDNVMTISAGREHSLAIKNDGSLWAWGFNNSGQIGDGTSFIDRLIPVKIMDDVVAVTAGGYHSFAIKNDASLWVWGSNYSGQLGDGTFDPYIRGYKSTPVKIMDDVIAVSAGYDYSLAIKSDGSLWAWGNNTWGQIGDGTYGYGVVRPIPRRIMDNTIEVSAGSGHNLAIKNDGSLWAWGSGFHGALGDGRTDFENRKTTPTKIMDIIIGGDDNGTLKIKRVLSPAGARLTHKVEPGGIIGTIAATVGNSVTSVLIDIEPSIEDATWTLNTIDIIPDKRLPLQVGENEALIILSAPDFANVGYVVKIMREDKSPVNFNTDRWSFRNAGMSISKKYYTNLFGEFIGTDLYERNGNGTTSLGGLCYGMAATSAAINDSKPKVSTFGKDQLIRVGHYDLAEGLNIVVPKYTRTGNTITVVADHTESVSAIDYIKYGWLIQQAATINSQKFGNNLNNYGSLYNAVKLFEQGGKPVVISMRHPTGGGHAVYALWIEYENNDYCLIAINDSNRPNEIRFVKLYKDGNIFIGWENSDYTYSELTYSTPADLLYDRMNNMANSLQISSYDIYLDADSTLLSTTALNFTYASGDLSTDVSGYECDTDILRPLQTENETSSSTNQYAYWAKTNDHIQITNTNSNSDFSLAREYGSISVYLPVNAKATLSVGDVSSSANIESLLNSEVSVTHAFIDTNSMPCRVTITAISGSEEFLSVYEDDAIVISGANKATIKAEENGKQYRLVLDKLDGHVKIKISDIILAKNIVNNSNNGGSNNTTGSDGTKNSDVATTNDAIVDSSVPLSGLNINPFTDINESDWFYEDVLWGHEHDLFKGTSKTEFSPHLPMTRAMMVTVLGRLYGLTDITSDSPFTDMDGSSYYAPYVNWAHQTGIATGIGGGKFAPELPITRQDLAAILYRYEQHINKVPSGVIADKEFSDWSSVSDYAKIAVNSLTAQGIINGKSYNLFDPQGKATRAEVAAMLHRFVESIKEK